MATDPGETGQPWTPDEVERAVATYFQMLRMQELGQRPNKAQHNRRLLEHLPARSLASVEYKHRNISAVLNLFGVQTLDGYKSLSNFQHLLVDVVANALQQDSGLDAAALRSVETPAEPVLIDNFEDFVIVVPIPRIGAREERLGWVQSKPVKRDYLQRESQNRSLGYAGELLVMDYEARRLHEMGAKQYIDRIEHVSRTQGDGAGFDILSFDGDGQERFIEVKTTAYAAETPFFVSRNEVGFSQAEHEKFHLYRLFEFRKKPRMFVLPGLIEAHCSLDAINYRAQLLSSDA